MVGFLGSTSENLIANLFESSHGMGSEIQLRLDELGPEDEAANIGPHISDDADDSPGRRTPSDTKPKTSEPPAAKLFSSPLGKLFSTTDDSTALETGRIHGGKRVDKQRGDDIAPTHAEEFDELRRQLTAMKNGQQRLEAMLQQLLTDAHIKK
ncbi:hypothetical protein QFC22_002849 [Naganishia vaughanmartiniae]|uniref:Uncharacterized protein n=1 Tax=Naganishia vaughanmartiniae TaxID=1424756 RepID=A0ACC2XC43_9TREE|nr:hypothetical protein QFC22_002849 [Naganishia vaughanmartiniae]